MRLLLDMNLSPRWEEVLAEAGFDAAHWSGLGRADATDVEIMAFAAANDFIVITHDLDFGAILAATQGERPSVVQIRADDVRPQIVGPPLIAALGQLADSLMAGALVTLDPKRARMTLLPLSARPR